MRLAARSPSRRLGPRAYALGALLWAGAPGCQDAPAGCARQTHALSSSSTSGNGPAGAGPGASPGPSEGPTTDRTDLLVDLLAQRPLALVYEDDALIIDTASPEVHKFLDAPPGGPRPPLPGQAGLILGERDQVNGEDRRVALADGLTARLRFPGEDLSNGATELSLWLRPAQDVTQQALSIFLNEKILANLEIAQGFQRYRLPVPEGRITPGENSLRLFFRSAGTLSGKRSAAAIARVALGPLTSRAVASSQSFPALTGRVRSFGIGGDARLALTANRPTRWSYHLVPPANAPPLKLTFGYGVQTGGRPAHFAVHARREGGSSVALWSGRGEPGRWQEADVSLAPVASDPREASTALRLDLSVRATAEGPQASASPSSRPAPRAAQDPPSLAGVGSSLGAIAQPRLLLMAPAPTSDPQAERPTPREAARAEHLLVFIVDALRADRVLPDARRGGHPRPFPALTQLLRSGAALRATSPGNFPLPAHASLLSGTYPAVHRMVRDDTTLPDSVPLLAETLRRAGFATGLFSGSGYVSERWGLRRGFDAYRNLVREGLPNASGEVWKVARTFLEEQVRTGHRALLYVAVSDPHAPYNPPPELLARTQSHPYSGPLRPAQTAEQLLQVKRGRLKLNHEDRAYLEALYDAEVLQMDATLGQALADLQRLGIADKTAVVFAGSHGEELMDHGSVGHGHSLYDELITVPVVLRFPPRIPAGERDPLVLRAELCDLMPTLLQLAGAAIPDGVQGESLLPLLQPGARLFLPRAGMAQHEHQRSVHLGRYHLIMSGERFQFFDLLTDPQERQPLDTRSDGQVALRALRNPFALFQAYQTRWSKARLGQPAQLRGGFLEEIGP